MSVTLDLTEQRFGRLVAKTTGRRGKLVVWECVCDCGKTTVVPTGRLRNGRTKSCGCLYLESNWGGSGVRYKRSYHTWQSMKTRCSNPADKRFKDYGGRGIKVCESWASSYEQFIADMGEPPPGKGLDRIDNDKGYEPSNCRWATPKEQASNRRNTHRILHDGQQKTIYQLSVESDLPLDLLYGRLARTNWTVVSDTFRPKGRARSHLKAGVPENPTPEN